MPNAYILAFKDRYFIIICPFSRYLVSHPGEFCWIIRGLLFRQFIGNHMTNPVFLSQFLADEHTQIRYFDMGRRVSKIRPADFEKFEQGNMAYPYPYQQTAWFGILFWNTKNKDQHNIWFLRMPLDERGHINLASRDEFMDMLLSRIGERISSKQKGEDALSHALKDNPYVFKPTEENMSFFNAKAKQAMGYPASAFLTDIIQYLNEENYENWQQLGLQGFADLAVRQNKPEVSRLIIKALPHLPEQPFCALCNALENEPCNAELSQSIQLQITQLLNKNDETQETINKLNSAIRALANTAAKQIKIHCIEQVLKSHLSTQPSILVMLAAKNWEALDDEKLLKLYLEQLAQNTNGQELFNALISDQMFMPGKRNTILAIFRDPDRSETLSKAVGGFFQHINQA
ncbi:MAG TPA: DUF3549 family protein [Gammaproteobacteria bacterium]|nr:DUF3549 family protein [Gammaproteobacteria bacterium]